jgi:hypothetical protein
MDRANFKPRLVNKTTLARVTIGSQKLLLSDQAWHEEALPKAHIISAELHKPLQANNMTKNMASFAFLRDAATAPIMAPRKAMTAHKTFVEKQYPSKHCTPNCSPSAGYPSPDKILWDHSLQDQALHKIVTHSWEIKKYKNSPDNIDCEQRCASYNTSS